MMHQSNGMTSSGSAAAATTVPNSPGLTPRSLPEMRAMSVPPRFCPADTDPYSTVEWDYRTAAIKDENGKAVRANQLRNSLIVELSLIHI